MWNIKGDNMTKEEKTDNHPTQIFAEDIMNFTRDIECLHTTLPLIMKIMETVKKETSKPYHAFMKAHAVKETDKDDRTIYQLEIKVDEFSSYNQLRQRYENSCTATQLIPRNFVTSLVSQYDSFLGRVIRFIFAVKPQILNASEKSIPYTDLIQFNDITAAKEYIIEKEVETVVRKSHADQFLWLKEKLGTPFNKDLKCWPIFIELTERRNLFVHCDGRVSSQYLKVCSENKCKIEDHSNFGDQLTVNPKYFEEAYKCIYEIGVKLAHIIWRRLSHDHLDGSDEHINDICFGLIEKGEYDLSIRLLDYFTQDNIKHSNDVNKRMLIINRAQAYKWANDHSSCVRILEDIDWSACGDNFKIAIAVLTENYEEAYSLMRKLKNDERFLKTFYKDWPLFKEFRKQDNFASVYEECYKEQFLVQKSMEDKKLLDDGSVSQEH
jgi:hypothetical protein